jgi:hypothetical protein
MTLRWTQWAEDVLLPLMYWQEQLRRTRHPVQKPDCARAQAVAEVFERHHAPDSKPELLAGWKRGRQSMPRCSSGPVGG